jgi:hypothetical protein
MLVILGGCKSHEQPAPAKESTADEGRENVAVRDEYYSDRCAYRVAFPPGTRVRTESSPAGEAEGAFFQIRAGAETLQGRVDGEARGTPSYEDIPTAEQCERSIGDLQLYRDRKTPPSVTSPFVVTYKVVKPGWYVFSGTRGGEILYEKGLHFTNSARLRISYPAAAKSAFDPLAARIANSFGEYLVVTAKAGVMVGEDGEAGLLFLNDVPDDSINQLTTCAIDAGNRQQFAGIKEGQPITVGGQPRMVNVRAQTADYPAIDHRQLDHCVLRSGRP